MKMEGWRQQNVIKNCISSDFWMIFWNDNWNIIFQNVYLNVIWNENVTFGQSSTVSELVDNIIS